MIEVEQIHKENPHLEAVIEIGATGVRLIVAQITEDAHWYVIDRAEQPVSFGKDVFTTGILSTESISLCCSILMSFKELLSSWKIEAEHITVIATTAFRKASNRDIVVDRLTLKTGFKIKIVDGIEENRLMYLAVKYALGSHLSNFSKESSIIMEIGGGSTEVMLLRRGKMVAAHSLSLGTVLIEKETQAMMGSDKYMKRFLSEYIRNTSENFSTELPLDQIKTFVGIGSEMRLAAKNVGKKVDDLHSTIERKEFDKFVDKLQNYSIDENVRRFRISYPEAESLLPALLTYKMFFDLTAAQEIQVTNISIREGMLISMTSAPDASMQEEFYSQVIASAVSLGRKFRFDEGHSKYVTKIALTIYDYLQKDHKLGRTSRLILEVAGILHDVGSFIRGSDHHIHSQYIIGHSDIFGLGKDDMSILSLVARYHRGSEPGTKDIEFYSIPRNERVLVLKLAAILRVADALDRSHSQRIKNLKFDIIGETFTIHCSDSHDLTLEKLAISQKGILFENVFGYKIVLT